MRKSVGNIFVHALHSKISQKSNTLSSSETLTQKRLSKKVSSSNNWISWCLETDIYGFCLAQRPYFGRQRFRSLVDNINILESEKKYIENPPEERKESFDELSSEERDLLSSLFSDMKYFFSAITSSLTKLSAQSVTMKLHVSELGEIRSLCSSLEHVSTQVERHASSAQRYSYQSKLDIKRVHRTLDFLTWLLKKLWHDLTHADEIDQYTCLRTWMALNYIMETEFDHLGWMDDCACQRRLMECKEMLLMCCDSEYVSLGLRVFAILTCNLALYLQIQHQKCGLNLELRIKS